MPSFFRGDKREYRISIISLIMGVFAGIFLIATVLTPWDVFHSTHLMVGNFYSLTGLFVIILYPIAIIRNKVQQNGYTYAFLIPAIIAIIYSVTILAEPKFSTPEGLITQITMQKIVQFSFITYFFIQGYGAWKNSQNK